MTLRPFLRHIGIGFTSSGSQDPSKIPAQRSIHLTHIGYELDSTSQGRQSNSSKEQILGDHDIRKETSYILTTSQR